MTKDDTPMGRANQISDTQKSGSQKFDHQMRVTDAPTNEGRSLEHVRTAKNAAVWSAEAVGGAGIDGGKEHPERNNVKSPNATNPALPIFYELPKRSHTPEDAR